MNEEIWCMLIFSIKIGAHLRFIYGKCGIILKENGKLLKLTTDSTFLIIIQYGYNEIHINNYLFYKKNNKKIGHNLFNG